MIPLGPVVARSRIKAARSDVWSYLADQDRRAEWWPELQLDPRVGGVVTERWTEEAEDASVSRDAEGAVDVWVEGHAIGFTWREAGDERDTAVLITLRTQGLETGVTITETGFDALPSAAGRAAASQEGWQVLLRDFATAVDRAVADGLLTAAGAAPDRADENDAPADAGGTGEGSADEEGTGEETVGAELVVTPEEVEGEVEESEAVEASLEVDPEPGLGEHLELDTGSVPIVGDDTDNGNDADGGEADGEAVDGDADGDDADGDDADGGAADGNSVDEDEESGSEGSEDDAEPAEDVAEGAPADGAVDDDPAEGVEPEAVADEAPADAAPADPSVNDASPADSPEDEDEQIPGAAAAGEASANDTVRIDRESIDEALGELGLADPASGDVAGDARQEEADDDEEPEEPDFDTLIRGL